MADPQQIAASPTSDAIRDKAVEVVARPEFDLTARTEKLNLDIFNKIADFFRKIFLPIGNAFDSLHKSQPILYWVLVITLAMIVIALLIHIIYSFSRAMRVKKDSLNLGTDDNPVLQQPATWETRARNFYNDGDVIGAIRCLFRASILHLEQSRRQKFARGATNRDFLRRYQKTEIAQPLLLMVETIDRKWYGQEECQQSDFEQCWKAMESVRSFAERNPNV